jgi:hypothetical protein
MLVLGIPPKNPGEKVGDARDAPPIGAPIGAPITGPPNISAFAETPPKAKQSTIRNLVTVFISTTSSATLDLKSGA